MTKKQKTRSARPSQSWSLAIEPLYDGGPDSRQFVIADEQGRVIVRAKVFDEQDLANARLIAAAPDLRRASQELYDRLQDQLDLPDSELPEGLVEAMDGVEAAWRKADAIEPGEDGVTEETCPNCRRPKALGGKVLKPGRCNLCLVVEEVLEAYGEVLVRLFPEARSGDQSPLMAFALEKAVADAATEWISNNVPKGSDATAA